MLFRSEADAADVPAELEPVLAREGRIRAGELVEEELLLALPIVPLHAAVSPCFPSATAPALLSAPAPGGALPPPSLGSYLLGPSSRARAFAASAAHP